MSSVLGDKPAFLDAPWGISRPLPTGSPIVAAFQGVWQRPDYTMAYLLGARKLIEAAVSEGPNALAMPILYLQRHAYELALKDLLSLCYWVLDSDAWLEELSSNPAAQWEVSRRPPMTHVLPQLASALEDALGEADYGAPPELTAMAVRLNDLEAAGPTTFRYYTDRAGGRSLSDPFSADLADVQLDLEGLFGRHLAPTNECCLAYQLHRHGSDLDHRLYALGKL